MVAIVTSTVNPETNAGTARSFYNVAQRLEQTKTTLKKLQGCSFNIIFLIDNSPLLNQTELQQMFGDFPKVQIYHIQQYQFNNKGINELLMLLYLINYLPANETIFKLSGRYFPTSIFEQPLFFDIAVKGYQYKKRTGTISTRGYWIKDREVLHQFLLKCLEEIYAYPERITGIRSLYRQLKKVCFNKNPMPLNISIEFAAANVLKYGSYKVTRLDNIGIEGLVAGSDHEERIVE